MRGGLGWAFWRVNEKKDRELKALHEKIAELAEQEVPAAPHRRGPRSPGSSRDSRRVLDSGIFAFEAIGAFRYFSNVPQIIENAYAERGGKVVVRVVQTPPTGAMRHRAAAVREAAAALLEEIDGPLHLVGHSTGGLDARLAMAPTASTEGVLDQVYSVVTVSAPHGGSPLASFFADVAGKRFLRMLTVTAAVILERGERAISPPAAPFSGHSARSRSFQ